MVEYVGHALMKQRTAFAFLFFHRRWRRPEINEGVEPHRHIASQCSQGFIKNNIGSTAAFTIIQGTALHPATEHLFKTQPLGAELHFISTMALGFSAFVFHWKNKTALSLSMEFHHVALTANPEFKGTHGQAPGDADAGPGFIRPLVGALMQDFPLRRELVFAPNLLNMNESALPLAKKQVLKGREGKELVFGVRHGLIS